MHPLLLILSILISFLSTVAMDDERGGLLLFVQSPYHNEGFLPITVSMFATVRDLATVIFEDYFQEIADSADSLVIQYAGQTLENLNEPLAQTGISSECTLQVHINTGEPFAMHVSLRLNGQQLLGRGGQKLYVRDIPFPCNDVLSHIYRTVDQFLESTLNVSIPHDIAREYRIGFGDHPEIRGIATLNTTEVEREAHLIDKVLYDHTKYAAHWLDLSKVGQKYPQIYHNSHGHLIARKTMAEWRRDFNKHIANRSYSLEGRVYPYAEIVDVVETRQLLTYFINLPGKRRVRRECHIVDTVPRKYESDVRDLVTVTSYGLPQDTAMVFGVPRKRK